MTVMTIMRKIVRLSRFLLRPSLCLFLCFGAAPSLGASGLTLDEALAQAYRSNPEINAAQAKFQSESAKVSLSRSLANPRIGLMRENNLSTDQVEMGPMTSWTISQEIMFPAKYFLMGDAQKATAESARHAWASTRLSVRQKVVSTYIGLYAAKQVLSLYQAQREALREIARIAEARRATGVVPQQDEMKAHVEQTKIENEILMQEQEVEEMEAMLNSLLKKPASDPVVLALSDFKAPQLKVEVREVERMALEHSRSLAAARSMVSEAETMRSLAKLSYAPDFMLSFRKPFQNGFPDAYAFSIEMSIPLWFFSRQSSEVQSASARVTALQSEHEMNLFDTRAQVRSLVGKVERFGKMIRVYDSALIPQAASTLNSSRAAYTAGRAGFLELLDSERSLYEVRIAYYRALTKYIDALAQLETTSGLSLSSLPFIEEQ